ncbi:MAG: DUF4097 domain-containing protein [Chloroflexi bacterium]|nr:DUF4097 domain-containing protein [Chloroflexota bacterium]
MSEFPEGTPEKGARKNRTAVIIVVVVLALLLLCCCSVAIGAAIYAPRATTSSLQVFPPRFNLWPFRGGIEIAYPNVEAKHSFGQPVESVDADVAVTINNQVGEVHVVGTDASTIQVTADIRAYGTSTADAQAALDRVEVTVTRTSAGQVAVRGSFPEALSRGRSPVVDLTIEVPRRARVEVTANVGAVFVDDLTSDVTATSNVGEVRVNGVEGALHLRANVGEVLVTDWTMTGDSEVRGDVGRVRVTVNDAPSFRLDAEATIGDIDCQFDVSGTQERRRVPGDRLVGTVGDNPTMELVLRTGTGAIELRRGR